jgi:hypothetical protein
MNSSFRSTPQPTSSGPRKKELLLPVGGRAYINSARSERADQHSVPLNDDRGQPLDNDLRDGEEVEILAWNPRSLGGLTYQVRRLTDNHEWWVRSLYLRASYERAQAASAK